jgi:hypothetical protein
MALSQDNIYRLLPAIHRLRDEEGDGTLKALVSVIAEQAGMMEDDIAALYRNWFIETCDPWVVPYIADLLGVRLTNDLEGLRTLPQRAYVANTLAYRRRKGTLSVLEEVTRDTTGWVSVAAEFFQDLATTQHMNHVRAAAPGTLELRDASRLQLTDTAFDAGPRTAEMRRIGQDGGRYNIANIGLFVWRAEAFVLPLAEARATAGGAAGRYFVDPLRRDLALANTPETETSIESLAREEHTPGLLRPLALYLELEARRQALANGDPAPPPVFMTEEPPFDIWLRAMPGAALERVPAEQIMVCHLGDLAADPNDWRRPPASVNYSPSGGGAAVALPIRIGIDPARGRLAFPAGADVAELRVTHAYLGAGDLGGGPYDRSASLQTALAGRPVDWQVMVTHAEPADGATVFDTLTAAVAAWNALPDGQVGVIAVADNAAFEESLTGANRIEVPEGSLLVVIAADWPAIPVEGGAPGETFRPLGLIEPNELRPAVVGDIEVRGTAPTGSLTPGNLVFDGLLIDGAIDVAAAAGEGLGCLRLSHLGQIPASGGVSVAAGNELMALEIERAKLGPVNVPGTLRQLSTSDSILDDGGTARALAVTDGPVALTRTTVLGVVEVEQIDASNCIFSAPATARRLQVGCLRFSYVAPGSSLPRRYRCQPDLALKAAAPGDAARILAEIRPNFLSEQPAHYGYGLLAALCPPEISEGADDGAAMGAFGFLMQPQRRANVAVALDEYLRFGLEAGLIEVT